MRKQHRSRFCRVWGYPTDSGTMALTTNEEVARMWSAMFRERGELPVAEFRLHTIDKKGVEAIREQRVANRERKP